MTVGQNANGGIAATAVSLFNISDLANPLLVDQADFPRGAFTLAAADHHAFGWFSHHSMLSLPSARFYSVHVDADGDGYKETNDTRTEHDLFSYRVDVAAADPLSLLGVVTGDSAIQRAAFVGDVLYTIAEDSIQSSHVDDPTSLIQRVDWELQPVNPSPRPTFSSLRMTTKNRFLVRSPAFRRKALPN